MADRAVARADGQPAADDSSVFPLPLSLSAAQQTALALAVTVAAVFVTQAPVLGHDVFNDDFVPLADIASRSKGGYIKDLFLLRDLTPNWRFLTGLVYLAEYRAFYLNAMPYLLVNVLVHTATAGLLFWLVRRATGNDWQGMLAGAVFGVAAASVPTVGQITAANNVFAGFFVTLSIVLLYEALEHGKTSWLLYGSSIASVAAAIASNESAMVTAPVMGLVILWKSPRSAAWWHEPAEWGRIALLAAPFAVLGGAALIGFSSCQCTEAELYSRDSVIENIWLYFGRLLYPIGLEFPGHVERAHLVAGLVVFALALLALVRGPALARISAIFLFLAITPYLPLGWGTASRYTYLASIPFAILAAYFVADVARYARKVAQPLAIAVVVAALLGIGWNALQTLEQNADQADASDEWRQLVTAVDQAYPDVPNGSTVYIRGGPITNENLSDELAQCAVMPAIGEVLWGDAKLFTFAPEGLGNYRALPGDDVYVGDYVDGAIVPQQIVTATATEIATGTVVLLPHVSPEASGNVCVPDVAQP